MKNASRKSQTLFVVTLVAALTSASLVLFVVTSVFDNVERSESTRILPQEVILASHKNDEIGSPIIEIDDIDLVSLKIACPDIRTELTNECTDALDEYFKDSVLPHWGNWIGVLMHLGAPPTFARVFEDPIANRRLTLDALNREACRLEQGAIHTELYDQCNADAIASHALFTKYCMPSSTNFQEDWFGSWFISGVHLGHGSKFTNYYEFQLFRIESDRDLDLDAYEQRKNSLTRNVFRSVWLETKCSSFDSQLTQSLNIWPSIQQSALADYTEEYGDGPERWGEKERISFQSEILHKEYQRLLAIAARLGDDWAITVYYRLLSKDQEFNNSIDELKPWLPFLRRATLTTVPRAKLLTDAIRAVELAERDGLEIDRELLIHAVCRKNPFSVDCPTAFEELESLDLSSREREIAIELRMTFFERVPSSSYWTSPLH